jgi:hypothetical protein
MKQRDVIGLVAAIGSLVGLYYLFRAEPCRELEEIEKREHISRQVGAPPWYPEPGTKEQWLARKAEMEKRCNQARTAN